ncbi:MAG: hypothetical protein AB1689_03585 [Thermodesulfobacteriota bacterium]
MFRDRDLALRAAAALLPVAAGEALTRRLTPRSLGDRFAYVAAAVRAAMGDVLGPGAELDAESRRFVTGLALDDLDACRAWLGRDGDRARSVRREGEALPRAGAALFVGFHLSGGLPAFDALRAAGFSPTFLCAPPREGWTRYQRAIAAARLGYLRRTLARPWIYTAPGARDALDEHLAQGGAVVALLDVPRAALELRDRVPATLFGRTIEVPAGVVRLARAHGAPIVPFDARLERGARIARFHRPVDAASVEDAVQEIVRVLEAVVRARPGDWHAWLEIDELLAPPAAAPAALVPRGLDAVGDVE